MNLKFSRNEVLELRGRLSLGESYPSVVRVADDWLTLHAEVERLSLLKLPDMGAIEKIKCLEAEVERLQSVIAHSALKIICDEERERLENDLKECIAETVSLKAENATLKEHVIKRDAMLRGFIFTFRRLDEACTEPSYHRITPMIEALLAESPALVATHRLRVARRDNETEGEAVHMEAHTKMQKELEARKS